MYRKCQSDVKRDEEECLGRLAVCVNFDTLHCCVTDVQLHVL